MTEELRDDLIAISRWADPVAVPDPELLDAHEVRTSDSPDNSPWRRALLVAAAALLVVGGVWVFSRRDEPTPVEPIPSADGWQETPAAPLAPRNEAQAFWTGSEVVVFGGTPQPACPTCDYFAYGDTLHDAAAYDPTTNAWRTIAPLPDASSYVGSGAVVHGDVYWLSVRDPSTTANGIDATLQRYSPADDTWTEIPLPAEVPPGPRLTAVGDLLVMYPSTDEVGAYPDQVWRAGPEQVGVVAPEGQWTTLPDDPFGQSYDRQIVDGGDSIVLFTKPITGVENSATPSVVLGATLFSGEWSRLPDSDQLNAPIVRDGATLYAPYGGGADGGEVNNWGRTVPNGGRYSLEAHQWSTLPPTVPDDLTGIIGTETSAIYAPWGSVLDVATGTYVAVPDLPDGLGKGFAQAVTAAGDTMFTFGGTTTDAQGQLGVHSRAFVWHVGEPDTVPTTVPTESTAPATAPTESTTPSTSTMPALEGDPAVWQIDPADPPQPGDTELHVLVTRLGCNGGVTGTVVATQTVPYDDKWIVTVMVEPSPGGDCPSNDQVAEVVPMDVPIGDRTIFDGACLEHAPAEGTAFCTDGGIRWSPPSTETISLTSAGGCSAVAFYALDGGATVALSVYVNVAGVDGISVQGTLDQAYLATDKAVTASLRRGANLDQSVCNDAPVGLRVDSEARPIAGALHVVIEPNDAATASTAGEPSVGCGDLDATLEVTGLVFDDGTRIADMTITHGSVNCFPG